MHQTCRCANCEAEREKIAKMIVQNYALVPYEEQELTWLDLWRRFVYVIRKWLCGHK